MKTWEMLEILAKYPEKKFNNKTLGQVELYEGTLVWSSNMEEVIMSNTVLKMEWEEVKEPVDFMEAVKSGKRFKLINKYDTEGILTKYMDLNTFMRTLSNLYSKGLSEAILIEGEFYIED